MNSEKWLVVINPRAGRRRKLDVQAMFGELSPGGIEFCFFTWNDNSILREISSEIGSGRYSVVVAAGGDGTVNRVAQEVIGKDITFGVLPLGSGNGLARSLHLSTDPREAARQLFRRKEHTIDTANVNERLFLCTAGVGFDAHIGGLFALSEKRGLRRYITLVMRELMKYNPQPYEITIDGKKSATDAFLITVANAGQYGNDFYIAPQATLTDGLLHVVVMRPFHFLKSPLLLRKILLRQAHLSDSISTYPAREVVIRRSSAGPAHYDGEPFSGEDTLKFSISPASLRLITGPGFTAV